jgi:hypothetical protein
MAQNRGSAAPFPIRPDIQAGVPVERAHLSGTLDNYVCAIVSKITFVLLERCTITLEVKGLLDLVSDPMGRFYAK